MKIRYKGGLPVHSLILRELELKPGVAVEVNQGQLERIQEELRTEFVRTLQTSQGEIQQLVSQRVPGFQKHPSDKCLLEFVEPVKDEPAPEPKQRLDQELALEIANEELERRALALDDRRAELEARERALEEREKQLAQDVDEASAEPEILRGAELPSAIVDEAAFAKKDELAAEVREVLDEKPADPQ